MHFIQNYQLFCHDFVKVGATGTQSEKRNCQNFILNIYLLSIEYNLKFILKMQLFAKRIRACRGYRFSPKAPILYLHLQWTLSGTPFSRSTSFGRKRTWVLHAVYFVMAKPCRYLKFKKLFLQNIVVQVYNKKSYE